MAVEEPDPRKRTNAEQSGGVQGGAIESVKRAVVVALKDALVGTGLDDVSGSAVAVEMEYPMVAEKYPGIWVQFSFTKFVNAGVGHELLNNNDGNWELIREFIFEGTITLSIMALTNLERDRLSDSVLTMLMFSRPPEYVLTDPTKDTKQHRKLYFSLANNPFVAISINHDTVTPGTQTVTPGVPWDPEQLGYEDSYSFMILGQANIVYRNDGTYTLRAVDMEGQLADPPDPFDWH